MESGKSPQKSHYLQGLKDISRAIMSQGDLDDTLRLIVRITAKVGSMEICSLWSIDKECRWPGSF